MFALQMETSTAQLTAKLNANQIIHWMLCWVKGIYIWNKYYIHLNLTHFNYDLAALFHYMYVYMYSTCCIALSQKGMAKGKDVMRKLRDYSGGYHGLLEKQQRSTVMLVHTPVRLHVFLRRLLSWLHLA